MNKSLILSRCPVIDSFNLCPLGKVIIDPIVVDVVSAVFRKC